MARKLVFLLLLVMFSLPTFVGVAQLPVDVPREEVFVIDVIITAPAPGNHNFWIPGPHPVVTHALIMETLWIRDQETGQRVYDAAISDPMYNDDFTQMSVDCGTISIGAMAYNSPPMIWSLPWSSKPTPT